MREIVFRGQTQEGEWVFGNCISNKTNNNIDVAYIGLCYLPCAEEPIEIFTAKIFRVRPETVGQFTSLYDKELNPIYEGDILQVDGCSDKLEVRFVRGVFAFLWNGNLDDEFPCNAPTMEWAKVIGNIHDNPALLKEK